jgi:hypothetical protein
VSSSPISNDLRIKNHHPYLSKSSKDTQREGEALGRIMRRRRMIRGAECEGLMGEEHVRGVIEEEPRISRRRGCGHEILATYRATTRRRHVQRGRAQASPIRHV